jgi:hypothetical protein
LARTRAERRYKKALIKKRIWARSDWNEISKIDKAWSSSKKAYIPTDEEFVKNCIRRAFRNEGKWRHKNIKYFYGCGLNCWFCNPGLWAKLKKKKVYKIDMSFDALDFEEWLNGSHS